MDRSDTYGAAWNEFSKKWKSRDSVTHLGDEWGPTGEITARFITPYLKIGMKVLEIGPGGGRYTERLADVAGNANIDAADSSAEMLERIRQRFFGVKRILLDGRTLNAVSPERPYDFVFSYDVFVHIDLYDIANMVARLRELVTPEAICVIHHSELGTSVGMKHWMASRKNRSGSNHPLTFSVNSASLMRSVVEASGFRVLKQEPVREGRDTVTVFSIGRNL